MAEEMGMKKKEDILGPLNANWDLHNSYNSKMKVLISQIWLIYPPDDFIVYSYAFYIDISSKELSFQQSFTPRAILIDLNSTKKVQLWEVKLFSTVLTVFCYQMKWFPRRSLRSAENLSKKVLAFGRIHLLHLRTTVKLWTTHP